MKVRAVVNKVEQLPAKNGKAGLRRVSLEGFSVLVRDGVELPDQGCEVVAVVEVQWKPGSRPIHWLRSFADSGAV